MTITARNYAAQVVKSLRQQAQLIRTSNLHQDMLDDAPLFDIAATRIHEAIHFAMPDGGKIFNDRLKGIENTTIKLPFSCMTIECFLPDGGPVENGYRPVEKRLVLAMDSVAAAVKTPPGIYFWSFCFDNRVNAWTPMPSYLFIPDGIVIPDQSQFQNGHLGVDAGIGIWLPGCYRRMYHHNPGKENVIYKGAQSDIVGDVLWALELLEALSCSNVTHEPIETIDPRKNAKRIKAGKLPIYETRILTIEAGKSTQSGQTHGGSHASPRQHLRRGHIRRLADKKIWVNSCVVGKAETGVIEKQYHVKAA